MLALKNKVVVEEIKPTKKVTSKDELKKKSTKDPYDMEGLKNILKIMSNEMVELKKQTDDISSSKWPFSTFGRNRQVAPLAPSPTQISATNEDDEEEEKEEALSVEE